MKLARYSRVKRSFLASPSEKAAFPPDDASPDAPENRKVQRCQELGETVFIHRLFVP